MSRKDPLKSTNNFATLGLPAGIFIQAALIPIDSNGNILSDTAFGYGDIGPFLINPESYEEIHSTGWVGNPIPGQSIPVYQWVAGGPRIVSFEALVTKDTSYYAKNTNTSSALAGLEQKAINAVGSIASNFLGASLPAGQILSALFSDSSGNQFDLDISPYLEFYRSLWKPTYDSNKVLQSPPLVYLYSGTSFELTPDTDSITSSSNVFVVTNISIKITKQLPTLSPMEALVSFQLEQYPISSIGNSSSGSSLSSAISSVTNFLS